MADKSPRKPGGKKPGKTLKEKRTAKTRTLNRGSGSGVAHLTSRSVTGVARKPGRATQA